MVIFVSCSGVNVREDERLRFALISNTAGESPYSAPSFKLGSVIKQINADNPVFLVHLGGLICSGARWDGISASDIERQYSEIFSILTRLNCIYYTLKADSDVSAKTPDYYQRYSKRNAYYSFNYGDIHFLTIYSLNKGMSEDEKHWIWKDLKDSKDNKAIFVFINKPLFLPEKTKILQTERCADYDLLHQYFTKYKVKAVFSGISSVFFKADVDGILYINAGCGGFNKDDFYRGFSQYYIVDYAKGELKIQPKTVN